MFIYRGLKIIVGMIMFILVIILIKKIVYLNKLYFFIFVEIVFRFLASYSSLL